MSTGASNADARSDRTVSSLQPLLIEPTLTPALWGGGALVSTYGKTGASGALLGEAWECWDDNRIVSTDHPGQTLGQARGTMGAALMGAIDPAIPFPILTKIIDAHLALSVQVHPDDAYAQRVEHQRNGKAECWTILAAEPGAEIILGWTRDTTREEYERRVADGTLGEILRRVPVSVGDAFYLPAGTLHAIGAGIQLFETQQTSDLTYRIFDWNRVGSDGKPRELHVSKAGDVLDFRATFPKAIQPIRISVDGLERTLLIADTRFLVEKIRVIGAVGTYHTDGRPVTMTACAGEVYLRANGVAQTIAPYQTIVIPAAIAEVAFVARGTTAELLVATPDPDLEAVHRLIGNGATFFAQFKPR